MNEFLTWLLDAVQSVDPVCGRSWRASRSCSRRACSIGLFVPGDTIVIIAGTAVASPLEGVLLGIAVVIGALIGESIGFWLGRFLGPEDPALAGSAAGSATRTGSARSATCAVAAARRSSSRASCRCCTRSCRSPSGMSGYSVPPVPRVDGCPRASSGRALYISVAAARRRHLPRARRPAALRRATSSSASSSLFLAAGLRRQEGHRARRAQAPRTATKSSPDVTPGSVRTAGRRERLRGCPRPTPPPARPKVLWLARLEYRFHCVARAPRARARPAPRR